MAIEAITFEENGWLRELTTTRDYAEAIAAGRLTRDTIVQCYDASGTFTTAHAGDVAMLQPIFADPTFPTEPIAEPVVEPAPVQISPDVVAPASPPTPASQSASGAPLTAHSPLPSAPPVPPPAGPAPAPAPAQPQVILPGDPRIAWPPPYPVQPARRGKRRGCGCGATLVLLLLLLFVAIFAALKWAPWSQSGSGRSTAAYTALGPAATFYITRSTNLRSAPDTSHSPVGRLARGTRITATRVRSRQGEEYVRVEGNGSAERFVWGYNVSADPPPALDGSQAGIRRLEQAVEILARPAAGAAVLERRTAGRRIQLAGTVGGGQWAEVLLDHGVGYVAMSDLAGDQPEEAPVEIETE